MTFKQVQVHNAIMLWSRLNGIINHKVSLLLSSFIVYVLNILYFNLRFYRVGITIHSVSFLGLSLIILTCAYCMKLKFILMSVFPLIFLFIFPFYFIKSYISIIIYKIRRKISIIVLFDYASNSKYLPTSFKLISFWAQCWTHSSQKLWKSIMGFH